jgi:tape measure domain-containing protein
MSEINSAEVKLGLDATGFETGLRKVDDGVARTGRNVENLGKAKGFEQLSAGADGAATTVDRTTKRLVEAIQRTTVTMQAGSKGTAEYYAALANARGANLATLRPYLDQLDQVARKTAEAAEAQRKLDAGSRFLDGLRSQADGIGKTAAQLAALRAEQLGVADAARPLIEQLQAAEEAAGGAEDSVSSFASALAAIGLGAGVASIAAISDEYSKYVSQLELATEGQTEFANAQANVRRISTAAQSDLTATASLYASITNGTRELGLAQTQVAKITETVSLALKVSGASGQESAAAILQLGQAFASGTLRGDEFNSVAEAAPRLMQALADGLGVPRGALRKLAEEGELTAAVLAEALPRALDGLQNEARSVETVGGAITVLKNNILEMVGATSQSSGVVSVLSGGINLLAENLTLAAGAAGTFAAVKLGTALDVIATKALNNVAANRALAASNVATAQANVQATAAASSLAAARVVELRAAVAAAQGNVALAIATNGLIPAQARAAAAAAAHTAALSAQTTAMGAASVAGGVLRGALGLLGGPIGAVITVLGAAATAWAVWGDSAEQAEADVTGSVRASTEEILSGLDKQIEKLRERNNLAKIGFKPSANESPAVERLGEVVAQIDRAGRGQGEYANLNLEARTEILKALGRQYGELTTRIEEFNRQSAEDSANRSAKTAGEWMEKYASNSEKLTAELAKARKELGAAFSPELEARIRKQYEVKEKGAAVEVTAYKSLKEAIDERVASTAREAAGLAAMTESQKLQARFDSEIASGKIRVTAAEKARRQADLDGIRVNEEVIASQKRAAQGAAEWAKIAKEAADTRLRSIAEVVREADKNEELARTFGMTKAEIERLTLARLEDQLAQRSSMGLTLDEIETLEQLIDAKRRSVAAIGSVEAQDAAKRANESLAADWKRTMDNIDDVFRQGFADMLNNGQDGWKSFTKSLVTTFKTSVADAIYKMFAQPFVARVVASVTGIGGGSAAGLAQAAGMPGAAESGGGLGGIGSLASTAQAAYKAISLGFEGISTVVADSVQAAMYGSGATTQIASNGAFANGAGAVAGYAAGAAVGVYGGRAISNGYSAFGGSGNTAVNVGTAIGAVIGGPIGAAIGGALGGVVNRAFGRKAKETTGTTLNGMFDADGFDGTTDTAWMQKGGWFRSDKSGIDKVAIDAIVASQFTAGYEALKKSSADFASVLGINADAIKNRTQVLSIALSGDQAKDQEAIAKFFIGVGDQIAVELVPTIAQFAKAATEFGGAGESASATLQRIAGNYAFIDAALTSIGDTFGAVGLGSVAARERLLELTGGLEAFGKGTAFFAQNFLTEAERLEPVRKSVTDTLAGLGLAMVDSRDEFKSVVLGLDLTTEAGAKTYASLMGVQEQFAALYPAVESTADALKAAAEAAKEQRQSLQDQLDELTMSPAQKIAKQRAEVDPSNVDLFDQVQATQAAKSAAEALASANRSYQDQIDSLLKSQMSAAALRAFETKDMDASTVALYDRVAALKAEIDSSQAAAEAITQAREASTNTMRMFADALQGTMDKANAAAAALRGYSQSLELGGNSPLDAEAQYTLAKQRLSGPDADQATVTAFLEAAKGRAGSSLEYARDFALAQSTLESLAKAQEEYARRIPDLYRLAREAGSFGKVGAYANGGLASGWSLVGEKGPELVNFSQPARVYTAEQTKAALGGGADVTALKDELRQMREQLSAALAVIATSSNKTADAIDDIASGRRVLQMESQ